MNIELQPCLGMSWYDLDSNVAWVCTNKEQIYSIKQGLSQFEHDLQKIFIYIRSHWLLFEFNSIRFIYDIDTIELTRGVYFMCDCIDSLVQLHTVLYCFSRSCTIANAIIHGHGTRVSFFKSFKNHTRLSRIHSNGPSVTRIRPQLVRLYVRFTRMANHISRVFCVRQALNVQVQIKE